MAGTPQDKGKARRRQDAPQPPVEPPAAPVMEAEPVTASAPPAVPWDTGPKPGRDEQGRILPGTVLNPGGFPKQGVHFSARLRKALLLGGEDGGRQLADLIAARVAEAILKEPGGQAAYRWLTWLEERDHGRAPLRVQHGLDPYGLAPAEVVTPKVEPPTGTADAAALDVYLQKLPPAERATTVRVLLEVAAHVPGAVRLPDNGPQQEGAALAAAGNAPRPAAGGAG